MLSEAYEPSQPTSSDSTADSSVPLPLALGGVGMLVAYALPGGLSGGAGFLIGLGIGFAILLAAFLNEVLWPPPARITVKCPKCGASLGVDCGHVGSSVQTATVAGEDHHG